MISYSNKMKICWFFLHLLLIFSLCEFVHCHWCCWHMMCVFQFGCQPSDTRYSAVAHATWWHGKNTIWRWEILNEWNAISIKSEHCHFRYSDRNQNQDPQSQSLNLFGSFAPTYAHKLAVKTRWTYMNCSWFWSFVATHYTWVLKLRFNGFENALNLSFRFSLHSTGIAARFAYIFSFSLPFSFFLVLFCDWKWFRFLKRNKTKKNTTLNLLFRVYI